MAASGAERRRFFAGALRTVLAAFEPAAVAAGQRPLAGRVAPRESGVLPARHLLFVAAARERLSDLGQAGGTGLVAQLPARVAARRDPLAPVSALLVRGVGLALELVLVPARELLLHLHVAAPAGDVALLAANVLHAAARLRPAANHATLVLLVLRILENMAGLAAFVVAAR